jgi:hypothetical protein
VYQKLPLSAGPRVLNQTARMSDRMLQGSIGRVSRAAPRAGPATVARKCWPAGPCLGRGPAWADNEPSWAMLPEDAAEDPADEPDVLY